MGQFRKSRGHNGHELLQVLILHGKRKITNERELSYLDSVVLLDKHRTRSRYDGLPHHNCGEATPLAKCDPLDKQGYLLLAVVSTPKKIGNPSKNNR
jgi:hypothetical protein